MKENKLQLNFIKQDIDLLSPNKFILLYIFSLSLYGIWWNYKTWKFFKDKDKQFIIPALRAMLAILFIYPLFEKIQNFAFEKGYSKSFSSCGLIVMLFIILSLSRTLGPFLIFFILSALCYVQPVNALNFAIKNSDKYNGNYLQRFTYKHLIILFLGGLYWILILIQIWLALQV